MLYIYKISTRWIFKTTLKLKIWYREAITALGSVKQANQVRASLASKDAGTPRGGSLSSVALLWVLSTKQTPRQWLKTNGKYLVN